MFPDMTYGDAIQFAGAISLILAVFIYPLSVYLDFSFKEASISFFIVAAPILLAIGLVGISPFFGKNVSQGDQVPAEQELYVPPYEPPVLSEPEL
jgi:hypothetical protein